MTNLHAFQRYAQSFELEGATLKHERFVFDLAELCRQLQVPLEALSDSLGLSPSVAA